MSRLHDALRDADEGHRHDLVEVALPDQRRDRGGLQPGHVEQIADQVVEAVGAVLDAFQQLGLVLLGPADIVRAQGSDRGLDGGERGTQVVADRGEQGGADAVALGQLAGKLRLVDQALAVEYDGGLGGEGGQYPAVLGGQHPAGERQRHVVADRHVDIGVLGAGDRLPPDAARAGPRVDVVLALQQGDGVHQNVSRTRSSSASTVVSPRSTLPARNDSVSDSARSRAAWCVRRAARSTTDATEIATPMKMTSATIFSGRRSSADGSAA